MNLRPRPSALVPIALVAVLVTLAASCSSGSSSGAPAATASTRPPTPVTAVAPIPAGTTLRVGDQLDYLKTVLHLAGQDTGFKYKVQYASFVGGPLMLQAFQAGSLDSGFVGSTPLIFAQAASQPITAVASWASTHGSYQLLSAPGQTSIHGWADLKGKKVAYQEGTAGEAVLLEALDSVGLELSDITPVKVAQTQVSATLQSGSADAGLSVEPLTSVYLAANPTARQIATTTVITDRSNFVIASASALADAGKAAALADFVTRLVKSFDYLRLHPDEIASAVYVKQYGLTPARAAKVLAQAGVASFVQLPGAVLPAQQRLADLFQANGEIPAKVNVASEFDTRFNQLVAKAQKS